MPPLSIPLPNPSEPLHLYRHLLREASYLPVLCRPWITLRIQEKFLTYRNKNSSTPKRVQDGQASLRYLRSANAGHHDRLEHLCMMATGRLGKRRRLLNSTTLTRQPATNTDQLERMRVATSSTPTDNVVEARKTDWLDRWSIDMITDLAKSQSRNQKKKWHKAMRKTIEPTSDILEGTNCLGRPWRPALRRNKLKSHYIAILNQILPPLPSGEWNHLGSLVKGDSNAQELEIPTRRPAARSENEGTSLPVTDELWDWSHHATKPARVLERGSSRRHKSLTGLEDQDPRGHGRPIGLKVMGPRKLQRMYTRIWEMSPTMTKSPGATKWSVSWGAKEKRIRASSRRHETLFQGLGLDGTLPSSSQPPANERAGKLERGEQSTEGKAMAI